MNDVTIGPFAVIAFLLELCAIAALGYCGFSQFGLPLSAVVGIGLPLIAVILWGLFRAPRRAVTTPFWARIAVEALVMGGAAVALAVAGLPVLGVAFAAVALVTGAVNGRREHASENRGATP